MWNGKTGENRPRKGAEMRSVDLTYTKHEPVENIGKAMFVTGKNATQACCDGVLGENMRPSLSAGSLEHLGRFFEWDFQAAEAA